MQIADIDADVGVTAAKAKLFTNVTAYMVVTFYICECRDHLPVHSYRIEAAMVYFPVVEPAFLEMTYESG